MLLLWGLVVGTAAMWTVHAWRGRYPSDMGWMSEQWLAEYRARHFD